MQIFCFQNGNHPLYPGTLTAYPTPVSLDQNVTGQHSAYTVYGN